MPAAAEEAEAERPMGSSQRRQDAQESQDVVDLINDALTALLRGKPRSKLVRSGFWCCVVPPFYNNSIQSIPPMLRFD